MTVMTRKHTLHLSAFCSSAYVTVPTDRLGMATYCNM